MGATAKQIELFNYIDGTHAESTRSRVANTTSDQREAHRISRRSSRTSSGTSERAQQNTELSVAEFFTSLLRRLDQLEQTDPKDRWLMYLGLRTMYSESLTARIDRDHLLLQATWKMLWPILKHYGLLNDYTQDLLLKERVTLFLTNQIRKEEMSKIRGGIYKQRRYGRF